MNNAASWASYNGCPTKFRQLCRNPSQPDPLVLSDAEYKQVLDRIAELSSVYLAGIDERPSFPEISGSESRKVFSKSLPEQGLGFASLADLEAVIANVRPNSPRFFGYVMGSGEPVAAMADLLAAVLNQNVTAWRSSPSAVTIERTVVGWLAEAIGCDGFAGSLTGGGWLPT